MNKRKNNEVFSMSFLDIMACGFGALVLILLISEFNEVEIIENKYTAEMFLNIKNEGFSAWGESAPGKSENAKSPEIVKKQLKNFISTGVNKSSIYYKTILKLN